MKLFTNKEIDDKLFELSNGWQKTGKYSLQKSFIFTDFKEALIFISKVGKFSEEISHYPKFILSNNHVKIIIMTANSSSVTELDFYIAKKIDNLKLDKESKILFNNIKLLRNGTVFERKKAATKLGNIQDIRAISSLIKSLDDEDHSVAVNAAHALGKIRSKKIIIPLASRLNHDDPRISFAAKDALINIGKPAVNELKKRSKNKNLITRRRAVMALGGIGDIESINHLSTLLNDKNPGIRWRSAKFMSIYWNDKIINILKNLAINDNSNKVRIEANETLKKISTKVKNLIFQFDREILKIDKDISLKFDENKNRHYYINTIEFLCLDIKNPYHNHVSFVNKKNNENNLEWDSITFQNNDELSLSLDMAKKSYELIKDL